MNALERGDYEQVFLPAVCTSLAVRMLLLSCRGSPKASLSAATLAFDNQPVNSASGAETITLSNTGPASLRVDSVTTTADFAQTNYCASRVSAGGSCTITLSFTPPDVGDFTGKLAIADNAFGSPHTVSLSGTVSLRRAAALL